MQPRRFEYLKGRRALVSMVAVRLWITKLARMIKSLHLHSQQPLDQCVKQVLRYSKLKIHYLPWCQRGLRSIQVIPFEDVQSFIKDKIDEFVQNFQQIRLTDPVRAFDLALAQISCQSHTFLAPLPLQPVNWITTYVH